MVKVENIKKTFNPHSSAKNQVLKGVSFDLPDKGLVAIFGKSGSGKTTLLNILGGLERADAGKITIDGEVLGNNVDYIRNKKIGFIFQNYYLEHGYTISEIMNNAMLIAGFKDKKEIERRSEEVLRIVDMERFKNKQGDALSGGQKQRVAIARALIKGADIILADEPTGNLDAQNTYKIMDILKEISKTKLVVLVTHEVTLIKKYADKHIKLVDGQLAHNAEIDEAELAEITYGNEKKECTNTTILTQFTQSTAKKNGRLFNLKNILLSLGVGKDKTGVGGNIFKQIFIFVMSVAVCFFAFFSFQVMSIKTESKPIDSNSVYISRGNYSEVRKLNPSLYNTIDFFETNYTQGSFAYNNLQSLSGIKASYAPKALKKHETEKNIKLEFGKMPNGKQVLITRALAEMLKNQLRIKELENDRSLLLMYFEKDYLVSGIVEGDKPYVYFNREDYVNFLRVYQDVRFTDNTKLFFKSDFIDTETNKTIKSYSAEITIYKGETLELKDNQCVMEINRNAIYKMMSDTTQADYRIENANTVLLKSPEFISIADSYPMYIRKLQLTKTVMTTDIRIHVTEATLNNIFMYISPNLDALGSDANYYFEISTNGGEQLNMLNKRLADRGVVKENLLALQQEQNKEEQDAALKNVYIFIVVATLMYLIYFFIEKSGSVKNSKEYGVYRAIGVNKSNLLFKETMAVVFGNLITYLIGFIVMTSIFCARFAVMNVAFDTFIGLVVAAFAVSASLMIGISLIPYLFVITQSPSKILSKYDI